MAGSNLAPVKGILKCGSGTGTDSSYLAVFVLLSLNSNFMRKFMLNPLQLLLIDRRPQFIGKLAAKATTTTTTTLKVLTNTFDVVRPTQFIENRVIEGGEGRGEND